MQTNQHGFTLVELLIGMVIVGVIFVGVGSMFQKQVATSIGNKDETEMQASAQAALNMIASDIIAAGLGNPDTPFDVANVGGTTAGSDTLTVRSTFSINRGMNTYMLSQNAFSGGDASNPLPVRCWGSDGNGHGRRNPTRDVTLVSGFNTYLLFVSVFDAKPISGSGPNPVQVKTIDTSQSAVAQGGCGVNGSYRTMGLMPDPALLLELYSSVSTLPRGTVIYAYLCPPCDASNLPVITYSVDSSTGMLMQSGQPILAGVEDFQVRFYSDPAAIGTPCPAGCDVLTGLTPVQIRLLNRVDLGLVVRTQHRDPHNIGDPRSEIVTLGHTLQLDATTKQFSRKQLAYSVRPKNSSDFQ